MINKTYKGKQIIEEMERYFRENGFLQLKFFLETNKTNELKLAVPNAKFDVKYDPASHSKRTLDLSKVYSVEILKFVEFFKSDQFIEYLEELLDFELGLNKIEINQYSHRDFIILNDNAKEKESVDVYFDISDEWNEKWGGKLVYTSFEDEILYLEPDNNTLTIVYKPQEIMKYLKYINNKAKNNKITRIEMKFDILN